MNPTLSSSSGSGQNETYRIERLQKVSSIYDIQIRGLSDTNKAKMISIHDHKGELTVTWDIEPTEEQKTVVNLIWELQYEIGENVIHEVNNS